MLQSTSFEPILLSRIGPPHTGPDPVHRGTFTSAVNHDRHQYLFYSDTRDYNWLMLTPRHKDGCIRYFRQFLQSYRPDLVHFQHTLFLGFDLVTETRHTLPRAPIIYTLHEYLPICHREGQMVRVGTNERCLEASPRRCNGCFPEIPPQEFFLRKRFISAHLSNVDLFLAPSRFLMDRYVDWGIPSDRIQFEEYGRLTPRRVSESTAPQARNRVGFFGQLTPFKGVDVLLEAMQILDASDRESNTRTSPHLWIHGANLDFSPEDFQRKFRELLGATRSTVTFAGRYDQARLPELMANLDWVIVPSVWWENSPLVIQEAFAHGRPVICSDIGGMAEKVEHGVNGLHFRANDAVSLAQTLKVATRTPELWETLSRGIRAVYPMDAHVARMEHLYRSLLQAQGSV
jgi:glycosyltransferase involved in cell wall biosynthesis